MSKAEDLEKRELFQNRIEELVESDNFGRSQLPGKIGISKTTFSMALNYGIIPKLRVLILMADYFQVPLDYLLGKSDDDRFTPSTKKVKFIDRLMELKAREKIKTDYDLSKKLRIPRSMINDWKNRNYNPSVEVLEDIAIYFGVPMDYLLGRID